MAVRRVLHLDASGLTAWCWRHGSVHFEAAFADDDNGVAAFAAYVHQHGDSHFHLLADVVDEEFRLEDIPWVGRRDRSAIVRRRLAQLHFATPLKAALSCGRLPAGRRDERLLLAALVEPQVFRPWLEAIAQAQAALAGVFSTAQLASSLPSVRRQRAPWLLVIAPTSTGLRQTFLEHGGLRFSRLTPLAETAGAAEAAPACAREAAKLRQYLAGRPLAAGDCLIARVIVDAAEMPIYRACCRDSATLRFEYVDRADEASHAGLGPASPLPGAALSAQLLLRHTPATQFAGAAARRSWRLARAANALQLAAAMLLATSLLFAGWQAGAAYRLRQASAAIQAGNAGDANRYATALQAVPASPLPAGRLRAVIERYDEVQSRSPALAPLYRRLAAALAEFPQVTLERLEWRLVERTEKPSGHYAVLDVHASLAAASSDDPRGQLNVVNGLIARLGADNAMQVRSLALPFDAASGKALVGSAAAAGGAPKFALQAAWRL